VKATKEKIWNKFLKVREKKGEGLTGKVLEKWGDRGTF